MEGPKRKSPLNKLLKVAAIAGTAALTPQASQAENTTKLASNPTASEQVEEDTLSVFLKKYGATGERASTASIWDNMNDDVLLETMKDLSKVTTAINRIKIPSAPQDPRVSAHTFTKEERERFRSSLKPGTQPPQVAEYLRYLAVPGENGQTRTFEIAPAHARKIHKTTYNYFPDLDRAIRELPPNEKRSAFTLEDYSNTDAHGQILTFSALMPSGEYKTVKIPVVRLTPSILDTLPVKFSESDLKALNGGYFTMLPAEFGVPITEKFYSASGMSNNALMGPDNKVVAVLIGVAPNAGMGAKPGETPALAFFAPVRGDVDAIQSFLQKVK